MRTWATSSELGTGSGAAASRPSSGPRAARWRSTRYSASSRAQCATVDPAAGEAVFGHWLGDGPVNCGEPFGAAFQCQPELFGKAVGDLPAWPEPVALGGVEVGVGHA